MKDSIAQKLETLVLRYQELDELLSQPQIIQAQDKFRAFAKERASIGEIVQCFLQYKEQAAHLAETQELLQDPEMHALAYEESKAIEAKLATLQHDLEVLMLPQDPNDNKNTYVEIRAGTGGDEAAIFVGDLSRMYSRYAENKGWGVEIVSSHVGDHGGYKEIILLISGKSVYSKLKFESGAHRVQRVPVTEAQGRIHTSACTVAVLPGVDAIDNIEINPQDIRVDTFRSSGAGGQHVNTTDSAIRITHIPTGVVVECQDERSQHKNRAKAMSLLQARILEAEQRKQREAQARERKSLVGSGDRSERIRTYNFPQGRVTDHRINLTLYKLEIILEGYLDEIIEPLQQEHQAELLAQFADG